MDMFSTSLDSHGLGTALTGSDLKTHTISKNNCKTTHVYKKTEVIRD